MLNLGLKVSLVILIHGLWAPVFADEPEPSGEPPAESQAYKNMAGITAGKFKRGLSFRQVNKILEMCQKVDEKCSRWWFKDEIPGHRVRLDAYWIDIYEVTNEKYLEFVKATGHRPALDETCETDSCWDGNLWQGAGFPAGIRNQPVTQVSWHDADAYCRWRDKRLPTEAEWEKAARGPFGNLFPWGGDMPPGRATYKRKWRGVATLTNVGSYPTGVSLYGIHDMAGNVWEWVADWYDMHYYKKKVLRNPKGPKTGPFKVVRGGSWVNYADTLHSAFRRWSRPDVRFNDTGFRCAKDAIDEAQTQR